MPRPAAKRNRLATAASKQTQSHDSSRDIAGSRDISRSPRSDAVGSSRLANSADPSDIIRQLRNQTPLRNAHGFALGSSPGTEQGATGSRPPTRARGYSSTLSIAGRKGDTSSRIPGTPAFESSMLSNFRRRPRQASILHMMHDEDGSSDLDDDDFLGGLSPEDESTPLNISRGKSLVLRPAVSSPEQSPSLLSSGKSSKRKRSVDETEASNSFLGFERSTPGAPTSGMDTRQRGSPADLLHSTRSPATFSETMVPPMSSPVPGLTYGMSTPDSDRQVSRANQVQIPKGAQPSDNKLHIPTAALQDKLLPRRRQRRVVRRAASRFDVLSESDGDEVATPAPDDDELSYLPFRNRSRTRRHPANKPKLATGNRGEADMKPHGKDPKTVKQNGISSRKDTNNGKENESTVMSSPLSSALESDEFDPEFDLEQESPVRAYLSEELRMQALKFAEVDKWQMEFEDVITSTQENGAFR